MSTTTYGPRDPCSSLPMGWGGVFGPPTPKGGPKGPLGGCFRRASKSSFPMAPRFPAHRKPKENFWGEIFGAHFGATYLAPLPPNPPEKGPHFSGKILGPPIFGPLALRGRFFGPRSFRPLPCCSALEGRRAFRRGFRGALRRLALLLSYCSAEKRRPGTLFLSFHKTASLLGSSCPVESFLKLTSGSPLAHMETIR